MTPSIRRLKFQWILLVLTCVSRVSAFLVRKFNPMETLERSFTTSYRQKTLLASFSKAVDSIKREECENSSSLPPPAKVAFSHVQLYTDELEDISIYKQLEDHLNLFVAISSKNDSQISIGDSIMEDRQRWRQVTKNGSITDASHEFQFIPQNRDIVKQLIAGLGFRITAISDDQKHVLLSTKDPKGVQFVVSVKQPNKQLPSSSTASTHPYVHFHAENSNEFYYYNAQRQGFAVLGFAVSEGEIEDIYQRYKALHPDLLVDDYVDGPRVYHPNHDEFKQGNDNIDNTLRSKVLEVYSYYKNEKGGEVDKKTRLRFIQHSSLNDSVLPGLIPLQANFDSTCMAAYCDHWVSNVMSRTGFIETLAETLGFTPKVDFNAGVVAAGEAQIESTVTGNDSSFVTHDRNLALMDQSQVYLPINNALSNVGHVYGFLQELGQGIQHIATRVEDLPKFVQRGNDFRKITGEGFTFLNIPRSYYGVLSTKLIMNITGISRACSDVIFHTLENSSYMDQEGAVSLDATKEDLYNVFREELAKCNLDVLEEYEMKEKDIIDAILLSRFHNIYKLLGDKLPKETYLSIVRNQILVDVQGEDLLFQIFTSNVLQKNPGDESPFLEFIQRVCSADSTRKIKAGCGGFGIRNFLTLFLSIEIGKAMLDFSKAKESEDELALLYAQKRVEAFTDQLNESNPILTEISDAMMAEGIALENLEKALSDGNALMVEECKSAIQTAEAAKLKSNMKLMKCSSKYNQRMKELREASIQTKKKQ